MAFVVMSWKNSFEGAAAVHGCDREHYRIEMTRAIRRLCDYAEVRIATSPDDDDHLLGFAAFTKTGDGAELHYVYVKADFRKMGIAKALLSGVNVKSYTFRSKSARPTRGWAYTPRFCIDGR
jgi:GNAT superfamily N-acetyltransferase